MELTLVRSSNLAAVGYADGILTVAFRSGSVYVYFGVPWVLYLGLMNASSHGSFFHRNIRTSFAYKRVV